MQDYRKNQQPTAMTAHTTRTAPRGRDWRSSISDHVAYALVVYTGLQIFVTVNAMKAEGGSILPYFALILLVAIIIPFCRFFEKRWTGLSDEEAGDMKYAPAFRRDVIGLWLLAIGVPFALTAAIKALLSLSA